MPTPREAQVQEALALMDAFGEDILIAKHGDPRRYLNGLEDVEGTARCNILGHQWLPLDQKSAVCEFCNLLDFAEES